MTTGWRPTVICKKDDVEQLRRIWHTLNVESSESTFFACMKHNAVKCALMIIKDYGMPLDCREQRSGNTPLHHAAYYGDKEIIDAILENGGHNTVHNGYNETPAVCAKEAGHMDIAKLLDDFEIRIKRQRTVAKNVNKKQPTAAFPAKYILLAVCIAIGSWWLLGGDQSETDLSERQYAEKNQIFVNMGLQNDLPLVVSKGPTHSFTSQRPLSYHFVGENFDELVEASKEVWRALSEHGEWQYRFVNETICDASVTDIPQYCLRDLIAQQMEISPTVFALDATSLSFSKMSVLLSILDNLPTLYHYDAQDRHKVVKINRRNIIVILLSNFGSERFGTVMEGFRPIMEEVEDELPRNLFIKAEDELDEVMRRAEPPIWSDRFKQRIFRRVAFI